MTITTTEAVRQYLEVKGFETVDIEPICGGTTNYLWRIKDCDNRTRILKHAEPHLSENTSFAFPVDRMQFEVDALNLLPGTLPSDGKIRAPRIFHHDVKSHVLILEDVGKTSLKDIYEDPRLDIRYVGDRIGRWLARLHASTTASEVKAKFNHATAKTLYRWNYNNLSSILERFGCDPALGERINSTYGSLLETDNECICHTDLWPGNILFDLPDEKWPNEPEMAVIDWEVARQGNGATDIGHFAGEAWFLDQFRGKRGLLEAFLEAYTKERPLSWKDKQRVAAQFGTHITHWPTIYVGASRVEIVVAGSQC